ncbi:MAG: acyl carrier protein [Lachnospiraceae bacterium]|nr:acyl carrier protein [Lachnospiraceae bacterium]
MEAYNKIFMEILNVTEDELSGLRYKDVECWDSVGHMTIITELEEAFGVEFSPDDMVEFDSYEKGIEILKKYNIKL